MSCMTKKPRVIIYILRRDVRLSDNPIFHHASSVACKRDSKTDLSNITISPNEADSNFTHLLPVYVFPAKSTEVSGFLTPGVQQCPYPEARSQVAGLWRTGPHRLKFLAEGAWNLKENLEQLGCDSGLEIRVGQIDHVVEHMLDWYDDDRDENGATKVDVAGVWMTSEEGTEEKSDERKTRRVSEGRGVNFKIWNDEKYFVDESDIPFDNIADLPNIYTQYRKALEPLRKRPRRVLPTPSRLPPLPSSIPPQDDPFQIPTTLASLTQCLLAPLEKDKTYGLPVPPVWPSGAQSAHPYTGGETYALHRLSHLISSGAMSSYKATRNGLIGLDFSTKLSAYLAQGHITARQIHWAMYEFEEGRGAGEGLAGYGTGKENDGTYAVRFELVWRDYMRLCTRKFGPKMFHTDGIAGVSRLDNIEERNGDLSETHHEHRPARKRWKYLHKSGHNGDDPAKNRAMFNRFRSGRTGIGLIDASNREVFLTGYTSNRARQNVASFLTAHIGIDWRVGAEWYEFLLTDYDVSSNWGNWQYIAGVGNDPRDGRKFNPVKQALDYDRQGEYVKTWVPELRNVRLTRSMGPNKAEIDENRLMGLYQAWRLERWEKDSLGLSGLDWVEQPLTKIEFSVGRGGPRANANVRGRGRGNWRGQGSTRSRGFRRLGEEEKAQRGDMPVA